MINIDKLNENLQEIADNDQLTGLRTRHYLFDSLNSFFVLKPFSFSVLKPLQSTALAT